MTIKYIAKRVLKKEDYSNWNIRWWTSPPSICNADTKSIWISENWKNQPLYYQYEIVLHEISHIEHKEHDDNFYKQYGELLRKYSYFFIKTKTTNGI